MTDGWMKFTRTRHEFHQTDTLNGQRVSDGTMFQVRFPSGTLMQMPAKVRREVVLIDAPPFMMIEERVYFAVPFEGLPEIWMRAIDVEVQHVPLMKTAKKK